MDLQRKKFLVSLTALCSEVTGRVDVGDVVYHVQHLGIFWMPSKANPGS